MTIEPRDRPTGKTVRQLVIEAAYRGDSVSVSALLQEVKMYDGREVYASLLEQAVTIMATGRKNLPPSPQ